MINGQNKMSRKTQEFVANMKRKGQEVRLTKNGHPYAVLRSSVMKKNIKRRKP